MSLTTILFSLTLNIIYYVISQKIGVRQFIRYFAGFLAYSLIIFFVSFSLELDFIFRDLVAFLFIYCLFFVSLFLSMSTKYIKSPTYLIFKCLKNKSTKKKIIKYLESQKVFERRIKDLKDQKIIKIKKNKIILTKNLSVILNIIFKIKKTLKLRSEG
jgi:hypothetical protein